MNLTQKSSYSFINYELTEENAAKEFNQKHLPVTCLLAIFYAALQLKWSSYGFLQKMFWIFDPLKCKIRV